jgi:TPR repeat protein
MKNLICAIVALMTATIWSEASNAADFQRGLDAYRSKNFATALIELRPLAEQGVAKAQSVLGLMYGEGAGVRQDDVKSVKWHGLAAEQGLAYSQSVLGWSYLHGKGIRKDEAAAAKWLRLAAEQKNAFAQNLLGYLLANGVGVQKELVEAAKLFRLAADQGLVHAQYNLGNAYKNGHGVPHDYSAAFKWYERAAEQEHALAKFNLGILREFGFGVAKDLELAMKWYKLAAELGEIEAYIKLGDKYYLGKHVPQDFPAAFKWFSLAAEQGDTLSKNALIIMYLEGQGVEKDYDEAAKLTKEVEATKWNKKATSGEGKSAEDMPEVALGEFLEAFDKKNFEKAREIGTQAIAHGPHPLTKVILNLLIDINHPDDAEIINNALRNEVKLGDRKAVELKIRQIYTRLNSNPKLKSELGPQLFNLLRASYAKGNAGDGMRLAQEYYRGMLVSRDASEALRIAREVISDGSRQYAVDEAEALICSIVSKNPGFNFDRSEARIFCKRSADKGDQWSQITLAYTYLDNAKEAEKKIGLDLLKQYSLNGNTMAMASLGWNLYSGEYGEFNSVEAFSLTKKAADQGVAAAINNLGVMYGEGIVTPKNIDLAQKYYSLAAKKKVHYAHSNLAEGIFFREIVGSLKKFHDHSSAAKKYAKKSNDDGGASGLIGLIEIVKRINRLPKDRHEALKLLKVKAIEGSASAALQVAWNTDFSTPESLREALIWFEISNRLAQKKDVKKAAKSGARRRSRAVTKDEKELVGEEADVWLVANGFNPDGTLPLSTRGTLTFLTENGVGVTALHVVRGCSTVEVSGVGNFSVVGQISKKSVELDIAVIKVEQPDLPFLSPRINEPPKQGEPLFWFGYPASAKDGGMATGILSATSGFKREKDVFQFVSPIQSGFSGGPVVDNEGQLLGIITKTQSKLPSKPRSGIVWQNANLAVKVSEIVKLLGVAELDKPSFWKSLFSKSSIASSLKAATATVVCNR